jgi:hypothetical protein
MVFPKFEISNHPEFTLQANSLPGLGGMKNAKNGFTGAPLRPNETIFCKIPPSPHGGKGDTGGWGTAYTSFFGFEKAVTLQHCRLSQYQIIWYNTGLDWSVFWLWLENRRPAK